MIPFNPKSRLNNQPWDQHSADLLWLLTEDEAAQLPDDFQLTSINGRVAWKKDIDNDTRFGFLAWGILESQFQPPEDMVMKKEIR